MSDILIIETLLLFPKRLQSRSVFGREEHGGQLQKFNKDSLWYNVKGEDETTFIQTSAMVPHVHQF